MIDITYGILNYNPNDDPVAQEHYENCVESLATNRNDCLQSEVYIIEQSNNSLQQNLISSCLAEKFGFKYIELRHNTGISRGINLLASLARGRFISLVTSDVIFPSGLDMKMVGVLDSDPTIYQICPTSDNSSLDHQRAPSAREDGILVENIVQELTIQFWPRTVFDKIGYFDERWKACYENMDFALRAFIDGGSIVTDQRTWCHHEHNMTTKNGAIHIAYEGYLPMPNGLTHDVIGKMWRDKWPDLDKYLNVYETITQDPGPLKAALFHAYPQNLYLPYVQNVPY